MGAVVAYYSASSTVVAPAQKVKLATAQHATVGGVVQMPDGRAREIRTARLSHFLLKTQSQRQSLTDRDNSSQLPTALAGKRQSNRSCPSVRPSVSTLSSKPTDL